MTDDEWKRYFRELDLYERYNGVYGTMRRPFPPSSRPPPQASRRRVALWKRSGVFVRDAQELTWRFCEWRREDRGKVTRVRFAAFLDVSDRTVARYCTDYELPWKALKRISCEPD